MTNELLVKICFSLHKQLLNYSTKCLQIQQVQTLKQATTPHASCTLTTRFTRNGARFTRNNSCTVLTRNGLHSHALNGGHSAFLGQNKFVNAYVVNFELINEWLVYFVFYLVQVDLGGVDLKLGLLIQN